MAGLWEEMPKLAYGDRALVRATDGQVEFEGVVVDLKTSPLLLGVWGHCLSCAVCCFVWVCL